MVAGSLSAVARDVPALTWLTNSSTKVEQLIGNHGWATGSNVVSRTIARFHIKGTQNGSSFDYGTNLIFLFSIVPVIDPASAIHRRNRFSFAWTGVANEHYVVQYTTNLSSPWTTFTNIITSTNHTFNFTNDVPGGLPPIGFYRVRTASAP